jgi:hypothetical protein
MVNIKYIINILINWIRSKTMARPRTIQLEHGEVSLQGFSKEQADALSEYIKNFGKEPTQSIQTDSGITNVMLSAQPGVLVTPMTDMTIDISTLKEKAIGIHVDRKNLKVEMITVAYNPETKEALVEKVEACDGMRHGVVKFKMAAAELNFV